MRRRTRGSRKSGAEGDRSMFSGNVSMPNAVSSRKMDQSPAETGDAERPNRAFPRGARERGTSLSRSERRRCAQSHPQAAAQGADMPRKG